jgi:hemerythrin
MRRLSVSDIPLTGNAEIDHQHRELVGLGDRLLFSEDLLSDPRAFQEALRFLARYVHQHFAAEERAMELHGHPALALHRQQHVFLRQEIEEMLISVRSAGATEETRRQLHTILAEWLPLHLRSWDVMLASFLREQQAEAAVSPIEWADGELDWGEPGEDGQD